MFSRKPSPSKNKTPLRVYWWKPEKMNFGDVITPSIIEGLWRRKCVWADLKECELVGAGSIIELLQEHSDGHSIKVWGSGFIEDGPKNTKTNLDFYAVRGPLSRKRVESPREVALGDPGILSNLVFKSASHKTHKVGVVVHYVDTDSLALEVIKDNPDYKLIDPLRMPEEVIKDITACEFILSSSLHGLIVADSFKIPNYYMPLSDKVAGSGYKFNDHYASTNRKLVVQLPTILGNDELIDEAVQQYVPVPHLKRMQRKLIKSFPKDLV